MKGIQIAQLVQELGDFAEWGDLAYWWSFSGEGSVINGAYPVYFSMKVLLQFSN